MIRIICVEVDYCVTYATGTQASVYHKTFDIEAPELEEWIKKHPEYNNRSVIGAEILS